MENVLMRVRIAAVMLLLALLLAGGCALQQQQKEDVHNAIISYVETKGQEAAVAYVDQLVADGKLGIANAEKIKAAIPQGIEKLKETMNGTEVSE